MFSYVIIAKPDTLNEFALQVVHICFMLGDGCYNFQFTGSLFLQEHEIPPLLLFLLTTQFLKPTSFFLFDIFSTPKLLILETALSHHIYLQIAFLLVLVLVIGHILNYFRFMALILSTCPLTPITLSSLPLFILVCFAYHKFLHQNRDEKELERYFCQDLVVFVFYFSFTVVLESGHSLSSGYAEATVFVYLYFSLFVALHVFGGNRN